MQAGSSYLSSEDPRIHFGLGDATTVSELLVRFPDGRETRRTNVSRRPGREGRAVAEGARQADAERDAAIDHSRESRSPASIDLGAMTSPGPSGGISGFSTVAV